MACRHTGFRAGACIVFQKQPVNMKRQNQGKASPSKTASATSTASATKETGAEKQASPLEQFFVKQLKDVYYVEQQLVSALEEMKQAATTEELEDAFEAHRKETQRHITRLEKVFKAIGYPAEAKQCEAIDGLISEAREIINETAEDSMTRDAALIIAAQKVEHYEIASYGGLLQLALTMDLGRAADLLQKTLWEEEMTDSILTQIAEADINMEAEQEEGYTWSQKGPKINA